ncbi:acyl carrier protein SF2, chloroplastic isoform X1 [Spinacia oleracea]|uniref:Acyl carrier protein SF2, chloroplastic isoform X1 n=1 Tax=Spinacia oleracea TaxID=3562 RepID=A0A9R0HWF1_SPIOL|nr:acyl carrier protein SF2, chloroplastic-like isoform X1 [Spinacia oleracea]XP_056687740.1 acyl carrier protein SF2, chloroplastic-like isoform X1 [Spinacia oleracea]
MDLDDSGPAVMNRSSGDESGLKISLTPRTMPRSHQCHYSLERKSPVMPRGLSVSCAAKPKMVTEVSDIVKSQLVLAEDAKVTGETKFSEIGADSLDTTSASLKFTVLNPKGRIWTMVAGGGASVIYADTVWLGVLVEHLSLGLC